MSRDIEDSAVKTIWTKTAEDTYGPGTPSCGATLPLGVYSLHLSMWGEARFRLLERKAEELIRFQGEADKILSEVQFFWSRKKVYEALRLPYRRGILLYGPPGTGKSSLIRIALDDAVERGGVGFIIQNISVFSVCYSEFRKLQPSTPIVAVIEDLENMCDSGHERELLDLLDGQSAGVTNTIFIATSNYIDRLPDRIKNRPSRFDRRIEIGFPSGEQRKHYFDTLLKSIPPGLDTYQSRLLKHDYVGDTDGMSLAHVKELFTAVAILGADYDESLGLLKEMSVETDVPQEEGVDPDVLERALRKTRLVD